MTKKSAATGRMCLLPRPSREDDLRMEQSILRAKQEWERTFDLVPDCILILDLSLCARRLNMTLGDRLGTHPRELLGHSLEQLAGTEDGASARLREMCLAEVNASQEMHIPRWGGHFLIAVSPFLDADGVRNGTIVVGHDISRWKLLEQQLEQSRRLEALGTLAGGIAHDFNTILGVILGYAELMQVHAKGGPQERRLNEILRAGTRGKELIRQILTFSRQSVSRNTPMRLTPLVEEVLQHLMETMPGHISVRRMFDVKSDQVLADPSLVHQVVLNLCTNALQAMRETGGTLELGLDEICLGAERPPKLTNLTPGTYVHLRVNDSGPGIPPDVTHRIFDPFFTTKRPGQGTGMGLAVAHGIVRRYGGTITAESAPGEGATLHVYLPQVTDVGAGQENEEEPLPGGQPSILLVDDEQALLTVTQQALSTRGYRVTSAASGEEALQVFRAAPEAFDLLLIDQAMPNMSGLDLAQSVLALRPGLPVVLCAGNPDATLRKKAKRLGIREVADKPVPMRQLMEILKRAL